MIDSTPFPMTSSKTLVWQQEPQGRILLVDDQLLYRQTVAHSLREHGFDVHVIESGRDTVRTALSWLPHVIMLDAGMSDADGFSVCKELKATPKVWELPVIFFSWQDDHASVTRGLGCGAVDFISKGMPRAEMIARIAAQVRTRQAAEQTANALRTRLCEVENHARRWKNRLSDLASRGPVTASERETLEELLRDMALTLDGKLAE